MGALKRAVALAALAALAAIDAADECRGPSACGCVSGTFCNFDDGDVGGCEGCIDDCYDDGLPEAGAADCAACCADGGDGTVEPMAPCLDAHASRLGVSAVPETASDLYRAFFCQYASITAPNGKPIEIFGGDDLSSLQIYRAKSILAFYLEDVADSLYGADKGAVADAMADNGAKLDMPNGAHEEHGAGTSLEGQELYWAETPVEGDEWFVGCDYDHRDAAFEEILHLVHDNGIGIDKAGYPDGALPGYQAVIRAATDHAQPTSLGGTGLWGEGEDDWIEELADEGSLTQEYLASVIDVYYGLWAHYGAGMWGSYGPATRADIETLDPNAWAMVPQFFADHLTWLAYLPDTFEGTFTLSFDEALCYTHKSQYYRHVALLGANDADLVGNDGANCFGVNAGANTVTGGGGDNVVMFRGACADYDVACDGGTCVVVDSAADRDGTTTTDAEVLSFDDGDYDGGCGAPRSDAAAACWALVPEASSAPAASPDSYSYSYSYWYSYSYDEFMPCPDEESALTTCAEAAAQNGIDASVGLGWGCCDPDAVTGGIFPTTCSGMQTYSEFQDACGDPAPECAAEWSTYVECVYAEMLDVINNDLTGAAPLNCDLSCTSPYIPSPAPAPRPTSSPSAAPGYCCSTGDCGVCTALSAVQACWNGRDQCETYCGVWCVGSWQEPQPTLPAMATVLPTPAPGSPGGDSGGNGGAETASAGLIGGVVAGVAVLAAGSFATYWYMRSKGSAAPQAPPAHEVAYEAGKV